MQVTAGATWHTNSGNQRHYSITLDELDLATMGVDPEKLSVGQRLSQMTKRAELLVATHVHKAGGMGDEAYRASMEAIKAMP